MATMYADRGFISLNGVELQDVENVSVKTNEGSRYVPTMTRTRRHKGVVRSNLEINVSFTLAVQNKLATPKLSSIDYENKDVALTFAQGADRYTVTGLVLVDHEQSAGGVGQEGKKTFNFIATDITDQVGNSVLFQLV